ncbi:MAG TPA: alpha/beta fold hydrolase [Actinocrinis sp.]|nr:alpha/beta fold hydrolase [Actinocrinis sp.]
MTPERTAVAAADGTPLTLHSWVREPAHAAVFYVHGIQSHAGWLGRTGPELARRGVRLYALDRRGSGVSGGPRGHLPSADTVLDDYLRALARVRELAGDLPLTAVGQSLGGSVLTALLARRSDLFDAVVWCAPALGQQRLRHSAATLDRLRAGRGEQTVPVNLDDGDYTDQARELAFMAADPLMLRRVTESTRAVQVELEDRYMARPGLGLAAPAYLARPRHDPIIDLETASTVLRERVPGLSTEVFDTDRHYLEFTSARDSYLDWLTEAAS